MRTKRNKHKDLQIIFSDQKKLSQNNIHSNLLSLIPNLTDQMNSSLENWEEEVQVLQKEISNRDTEKANLIIEVVMNKLGLTGKEREDVREFLNFYLDLEDQISKSI